MLLFMLQIGDTWLLEEQVLDLLLIVVVAQLAIKVSIRQGYKVYSRRVDSIACIR
jgi:hypothetical protein